MLDVRRLDAIQCTTALEVELLAALIRERRLRLENAPLFPAPPPSPDKPTTHIYMKVPADFISASSANVLEILTEVGRRWNVTVSEMQSQRRQVFLVEPRQIACMLARALTKRSYPEIGRMIGNRDHSTVFYGAEKYDWLRLQLMAQCAEDDPLSTWVRAAHAALHPPVTAYSSTETH